MKEWTRKERYRKIEEVSPEYLVNLANQVEKSVYRQMYHIQPPTGLLNDPNGFSYFNGQWHLFYQWFPLGPVHGLKYWYHVVSDDLVHWENCGVGISPSTKYDSHGAYSGSGLVDKNQLHLMYTGNTRSKNWSRTPHQLMAIMDKSGQIKKIKEPVIEGIPEGYTDNFRDPKMWKHEGYYYAIIGAERKNHTGTALVYQSENLTDWVLLGEFNPQVQDFGFMWECPDFFELDGSPCFLFSPQGIEPTGDFYQNIYQTGYFLGTKFNYETLRLEHNGFHELDLGFDFYAAQTTIAPDGRRILIAWMGLPEIKYPSDQDGWAHCLTIPRELSVLEGQLIQRPITELTALRGAHVKHQDSQYGRVHLGNLLGTSYEVKIKLRVEEKTKFGLCLFEDPVTNKGLYLEVDLNKGKFKVERKDCGIPFATEYGTSRQMKYNKKEISLHIFVDTTSAEIFVNDGLAVFTTRVFPENQQSGIGLFVEKGLMEYELEGWKLNKMDIKSTEK
ncbi:MAG: sucrose-6-phosphate hydrolase [Carnobacterium sp.]|uniref:glycoside hydrolase family 32 protein n=1 Tax=Carnobacterium sp. TaxID=48221 RepID=UPI00257F5D3E|nr:sucrose-6-phosphate hydrolase [Carnobacterium sp.]MBQ6484915.1 sucrose-6-phosphate hydrolase [Carnobacterium sp.]